MFVRTEDFTKNIRGNKVVLKELAALVTQEIQSRSSQPAGWDFRFLLIVAQWLIEQGGYTMTPEGNNPGNVVGTGDVGFFTRPFNTEFVNGVSVPSPDVKFAKYSTIEYATARKFDYLRDRWPLAYQAVLAGTSSDDYVNGLYPGYPKNYATKPKPGYLSGMRFRLKQVVPHYILACEDDIKEIDQKASGISSRKPAPGESLDYSNDVTLNRNMRSVLENLLGELKKVNQRVLADRDVQG
jgi:hypothetical protein